MDTLLLFHFSNLPTLRVAEILATNAALFVKVYLTAGAVYGLEGTLGDLEHCARSISSGTTDTELAFLEDQVATAAAQVQQSELQVPEGSSLRAVSFHIRTASTAANHVQLCLAAFPGVKHRSQDIGSENGGVERDRVQPLLQVQAKT